MQQLQFQLGLAQLDFQTEQQKIHFDHGLVALVQKCVRHQRFDALAIEYLIYEIEEILERLQLDYQTQRYAQSNDSMLHILSQTFFEHATHIDRQSLEHGFNEMIEHTEYYQNLFGEQAIIQLSYFVFIREMMHHLNIQHIQVLAQNASSP
ncbi:MULTISPECIES: hypothetical protein [unclassified Acinetobacter]|uniref:hypothetical protein n=1 Tax=unclassified Acinetobacter TaxID=196816 RepID=UPI0015D3510B|nr:MULTISPECIES: hypothetical protein [unclassified Acinetobacter]